MFGKSDEEKKEARRREIKEEVQPIEDKLETVLRDNERILQENEKLRKQVKQLSYTRIGLRRAALIARRRAAIGRAAESDARHANNRNIYAGDIVGDIEAMQFSSALASTLEERADWRYEHDFQNAYGICYGLALRLIPNLPVHVVRAFDILATVRELCEWKDNPAKQRVEHLAKHIVDELTYNDEDKRLEEALKGNNLLIKLNRLEELYSERRSS
ncbi:hypothetical protein AJ80_08345 [Polytolypa hystricis UAMH7299]|uniref:Uncharacterized protein n=1 Tax=Polytolypa hystricis (strain UAMH7299) TaxID=1447883 RepID=A0A2B7X9J6_POLH7|nr:hypothetical protein AJ80_08345 [Polytolypa hystricis UAMH7299]